jgi:prepilin-type N-terminal cleavage/methylation domain-containing protein
MPSYKKGFTIVEIVIVVVVLVIAGLIAFRIWDSYNTQAPVTKEQRSEEVQTAEDLDKVDKMLDETNIEGDETNRLDAEVNF